MGKRIMGPTGCESFERSEQQGWGVLNLSEGHDYDTARAARRARADDGMDVSNVIILTGCSGRSVFVGIFAKRSSWVSKH